VFDLLYISFSRSRRKIGIPFPRLPLSLFPSTGLSVPLFLELPKVVFAVCLSPLPAGRFPVLFLLGRLLPSSPLHEVV